MNNPIEQLKNEYDAIGIYLSNQDEVSLLSDFNKHFRKVFILSASSYFEHRVTAILSDFAREKSNGDERIVKFLEKQAISGKYHQLFDWGKQNLPDSPGKNANRFFSFFGDDFKKQAESDVRSDDTDTEAQKTAKNLLKESTESFLEIGHLRNILVHNNFAEYNYEQKTIEELFILFQKAKPFLDYLTEKLK